MVMAVVTVARISAGESWARCMVALMPPTISESRPTELESAPPSMKGNELVKQITSRQSTLVMNMSGKPACRRPSPLPPKIMTA